MDPLYRPTVGGMPAGRYANLVSYEGDIAPPITGYASTAPYTPMVSRLTVPATSAWTRSSVVNRVPRRGGLRYFYSHGGTDMPAVRVPYPGGADGRVHSSMFQRTLVTLHDWSQHNRWFEAGYPRNLGWSFRVSQLKTQRTGGSGPGAMAQRPLFPRVQRVPRYTSVAPSYVTRSAKT